MQELETRLLRFLPSSQSLGAAAICLLFMLIGYGQPQPTDQFVTLVDSFKVRVRATPEILPDNILASLFKGTQLPIVGEGNGWYQVSLPDGRSGWVHGDYGKVEKARDQLEIAYEVVKVRAQPTTNSDSVARTIMGQRIHLLEEANGWYKVEIPNETEGWVRQDMVTLSRVSPPEQEASVPSAVQSGAPKDSGSVPAPEALQPTTTSGTLDLEPGDAEKTQVETVPKTVAEPSAEIDRKPSPSAPVAKTTVQSDILTEVGTDWLTLILVTAGVTLLAAVLFALVRHRRVKSIHQTIEKGRSKTNELERTLVLEMKAAQRKLSSLDKEAQNRLQNFRDLAGDSSELSSKTSEDMLSSLEELRAVIENQQKRMDLYSELVSLQNQQIDAYKQENVSLQKLLELKKEA